MPLIIEGSDNMGKTTAAKRIIELAKNTIPVYYNHMTRPGEAFNWASHYSLMAAPFAVQDRFHIGAYAWHDPMPIFPSILTRLEEVLADMGSLTVVFATENHKEYERRLMSSCRDEMFNVSQILIGNHRFIDCQKKGYHVDIFWDTLKDGYPSDNTLNHWILQWISKLDEKGWVFNGPDPKSARDRLSKLGCNQQNEHD